MNVYFKTLGLVAFLSVLSISGEIAVASDYPPADPIYENYQSWLIRYGLQNYPGLDVDLTGDGISNVMNYAAGLDPLKNNSHYFNQGVAFETTPTGPNTMSLFVEHPFHPTRAAFFDFMMQYSDDLGLALGWTDLTGEAQTYANIPWSQTKPARISKTYTDFAIQSGVSVYVRFKYNIRCDEISPEGTEQTRVKFLTPQSQALDGCPRETQIRTCSDGLWTYWSGSYQHDSCTLIDPTLVHTTELDLNALAAAAGKTIEEYMQSEMQLVIPQTFNPGDEQLFETYSAGQVVWKNNWLSNLDFTGVAWNQNKAGTLVTKQHMVQAKHWHMGAGEEVIFHKKNGTPVVRTTVGYSHVGPIVNYYTGASWYPDATVVKLNAPVPDDIAVYQLPKIAYSELPYYGWQGYTGSFPLLATDQNRKVTFLNMDYILGYYGYANYDPPPAFEYPDYMVKYPFISGDSSNPVFMVVNGKLVLSSTFTSAAGSGPFYGDPVIKAGVERAIETLGF